MYVSLEAHQSNVRSDDARSPGEMRVFSHLRLALLCEVNCPHLFSLAEEAEEATNSTSKHVQRNLDEGRY